jgi:ribonucleoside-diphosphate reductase alpha chain
VVLSPFENINMTLPLQPASQDIWSQKYCLRDAEGNPQDVDLEATLSRTAKAVASVEKDPVHWEKEFFRVLMNGATPAGRILSNAGASEHKTAVSLINCTVSDTIPDSMDGILAKLHEAGMTLKAGCGIGYEFSTLRPEGAHVSGAGAKTNGPLSFMDVYDAMCFTVSSAGGRRGAQMATFDVSHPDVLKFISAKRENGRLRQFNCSLLINDSFITAVKEDSDWQPEWNGEPFGPPIPARQMWQAIMDSNYDFAEPGFLLIDRINRYNNLWFTEHLRATNPCGEQPLPPYGSCLLGSMNLTRYVVAPFSPSSSFDFSNFYKDVRTFTRLLDNVVELNGLPLSQQRHEITHKRRHGMGYLGLGSAMAMMGIRYGSQQSVEFTRDVTRELAFAGFHEGAMLAREKGEAPALTQMYSTSSILGGGHHKYNSNWKPLAQEYSGRELFLRSHYFDAWREDSSDSKEILKHLRLYGSRFTHHSSIAPTGTISLSFGNNASNGIEPTFSHAYTRNRIVEGRKAKEAIQVCSYEYLAYKTYVDPDCTAERDSTEFGPDATSADMQESALKRHALPAYFVSTDDLTPKQHVDIQAAAQEWVDSSISKTINVPTDISKEDFQEIYMYAQEKGLKGCTTFRFNPEAFQGVLVKNDELKSTLYTFNFEDGSALTLPGDQQVEYDGQTHTAANLYDAIKEGYYGKF